MNTNEYYNDIRKDIAIEFGLDAIGFGANRLDTSKAREYLAQWNALSTQEQNEILKKRGW